MGMVHGPNLVTDGLCFYVDAGNVQSYPGSGSTWYDLSGNGFDGAITGATYNSADGGKFVFSLDDRIDLPDTIGYTTDVSAFVWYKKTTNSPTQGYHILLGTQELELSLQATGAYIRNGIYTNVRYVSNDGSGLNNFDWHYVGLTFSSSGNIKRSYIDSAQAGTQSTAGALAYSIATRQIGSYSTFYYLTGEISNVCIWNRALSAAEVLQNYNAHKSRFGL